MSRNKIKYEFTEEEQARLFQERCDCESMIPETEEQMRLAAKTATMIFGGDPEKAYQIFKERYESKKKRQLEKNRQLESK